MAVVDDYIAAVMATGPQAFWPMQEASGSLTDVTGNGHTAVDAGLGGTLTYNVDGPRTGCPKFNAIQFTQNTGFVAADDDVWSSTALSYSGWVWSEPTWSDTNIYRWFLMKEHPSYYEEWFGRLFRADWGTDWQSRIVNTISTGWSDVLVDPVADGRWTHIAATYDGVNQRVYFDGVLVGGNGSGSASPRVGNATGPLAIGHHSLVAGRSWIGRLSMIAFWSRELDASEVAAMYAAVPSCRRGGWSVGMVRGGRG